MIEQTATARLKRHISRHKILLLAIVCSAVLHTLLLSGFSITLPESDEDHQFLDARLVNLPPAKKIQATPAPKVSKPKPEHKIAAKNNQETKPASAHDINPIAEPIQNTPPDSAPQPVTEPAAAIAEAADTAASQDSGIEQLATPYQHVETEFEVRRGTDTSAIGSTRVSFNIESNGTYAINSTTEAKGLVSLFFNPLIQKSEGAVAAHGLKPNFYSYEYGKNKKQTASFAWSDGLVLLHTNKADKTEKLPAGTQDLLSFMYQFMFKPPLDNMEISIANGKTVRTYTYSFEGEEVINTKLGKLKTLHILKAGNEEEKTEIWLGIDYQYLPVKIRKTEKNAETIEQTVTKISTELPQLPANQ